MSKTDPHTKRLSAAKRYEKKLVWEISFSTKMRQTKKVRHLVVRYLQSFDAKLVAAHSANKALKPHCRVSQGELVGIAEKLDPWSISAEDVVLNFKKKPGSEHDFRPIFSFGIENRARQLLIQKVLLAQARRHSCQFATRGGRTKACQAVIEQLAQGPRWVTEVDIANCYGSFEEDEVPGLLPLPRKVTNHSVITRHLKIVPGNIIKWFGIGDDQEKDFADEFDEILDQLAPEVRSGIAQGSAASPLVAEMLLAPVFGDLPKDGKVINFADNFLIVSETNSGTASMIHALTSALLGHPAGPLFPKIHQEADPHETFDFLGYTFTGSLGDVIARPTERNVDKFNWQLSRHLKRLKAATSAGQVKAARERAIRYVKSWSAAFSLWQEVKWFRGQALATIQDTAEEKIAQPV